MTDAATVLGPVTRHYWLVQRMARATGVDLVDAWKAGQIDHGSWSDLVTQCRGCAWSDGCRRWLDAPVDEIRPLPAPCRNGQAFDTLRRGLNR